MPRLCYCFSIGNTAERKEEKMDKFELEIELEKLLERTYKIGSYAEMIDVEITEEVGKDESGRFRAWVKFAYCLPITVEGKFSNVVELVEVLPVW